MPHSLPPESAGAPRWAGARAPGPTARRPAAGPRPAGRCRARRLPGPACLPAPDQLDRLPRLGAAPLDHDRERGEHGLRVTGVGGDGAAHRQPGGALLGGVDGPPGAQERRAGGGPGAARQRGLTGPAPIADAPAAQPHELDHGVDDRGRDRRGRPGTRRPRCARRRERPEPRRSAGRARRDPVRTAPTGTLVNGEHVGHRARLTPFLSTSKASELVKLPGGKPPVAIGPQSLTVTRSSDFPCRVMASRYSSQSGCSPLMAR